MAFAGRFAFPRDWVYNRGMRYFFYIFALAVVFTCPLAFAGSDGYEGLIAPSKPAVSQPPSKQEPAALPASSGYEGVLAPAPNPSVSPLVSAPAEPLGYSGLIPGAAPKPAASPAPEKSLITKGAEGIKALAAILSKDKDGDGLLDKLKKPTKVPEQTLARMNKPRGRIEGMLPAEYAARRNVDDIMKAIGSKEDAARAENILNTLADGFRAKKSVPERVYKQKGLSDDYIKEEREGTEKALARINAALDDIKKKYK